MKRAFFIVGPTATGKSEIAAEIACQLNAEIVSADAFQIYQGLDILSCKPTPSQLLAAPHHLISKLPLTEPCDAQKYAVIARATIARLNKTIDTVLARLDKQDSKIQGVSDQVKMAQAQQIVLGQP